MDAATAAALAEALDHAQAGRWDLAHAVVQRHEGEPSHDWLHAILHRKEGDLGNSRYWYRSAGRAWNGGPVEAELAELASWLRSEAADGV